MARGDDEQMRKRKEIQYQYKAVAKDRETGRLEIVCFSARSLRDALHEIRLHGYSMNSENVKPAEVFDYITEHTSGSPWDWKNIKSIPQE